MIRLMLLLSALLTYALPAQAQLFVSVEERGAKITADLQGNESYHALLARKLASIATTEKGQHDLRAAKTFIKMAEDEAAKAGGSK